MAQQSDNGGGGGTTTTVCTPSPSDNLAILNNLVSRIADIERFLSMLVGADVYASNLSELATDMGNLLNGSIVMPSTSWAGAGGSIPVPADFNGTVMSGNIITTWTNGVVSFEVVPSTGITVGGGGVSSAWYENNTDTSVANGSSEYLNFTATDSLDTSSLVSVGSIGAGDKFIIASDGLYQVTYNWEWGSSGPTDSGELVFTLGLGSTWAQGEVAFAYDQNSLAHYTYFKSWSYTKTNYYYSGDECHINFTNASTITHGVKWTTFGLIKLV